MSIPSGFATAGLGATIGAAYLGAIAAGILYGMTNIQVFLYYRNYWKDWTFQRCAVALLWVLDTLHMSLTAYMVYHYVIDSFGKQLNLAFVHWSFKTIVLFGGYAVGIILAIKTYSITTFFELEEISWVIHLSFATTTFIDIVIAGVITRLLSLSKTSFAETNSRIWIVIRYVLISGTLTTACSITALITFAVMPHNLVFLGIEFLLTKLYVNSYLAMLNARKSIRDKSTSNASGNVIQLSDMESSRYPTTVPPTSPIRSEFDHHNNHYDYHNQYRTHHTHAHQRKPSADEGHPRSKKQIAAIDGIRGMKAQDEEDSDRDEVVMMGHAFHRPVKIRVDITRNDDDTDSAENKFHHSVGYNHIVADTPSTLVGDLTPSREKDVEFWKR
ncbi:hypothetical protein AMATHDRAFT_6043 [Amanita thiersii Skay4041]|uniref:DUF6534 domain-containing protein n=1 Tax=Amanita thiersii Skay4041 TaxID=703135 RepID=A0A2A9NKF8_9AGAR|nr:hypothetical protein AMATHDRAFT_6043 [Amanita thiersii Skay4041]